MRMVEKGPPHFVKQDDGTYRMEIPVDFEFDSQKEEQEVEHAMREQLEQTLRQLRGRAPGRD